MQRKLLGIFCAFILVQQCLASSIFDSELLILKNRLTKASSTNLMCSNNLKCAISLTKQFYQENKYYPIWSDKDGNINSSGKELIEALHLSYLDGLNPYSYHIKQIDQLVTTLHHVKNNDKRAWLLTNLDLTLTDGFFLYASNLYYGLVNARSIYPYWQNIKKPIKLLDVLKKAIDNNNPKQSLSELAPTYLGYAKLKEKLNEYQMVAQNKGWAQIPDGEDLKLGSSGDRVSILQHRLEISGELGSNYESGKFDKIVEDAVKQFQYNNGIYDDGVVDHDTLKSLNVSVKIRIRIMELNLDKMRLLPQEFSNWFIMVNLPEYALYAYKDGKIILTMDVAVGGTNHPSCVLNSKIHSLILNPYWNVPADIAKTEFWPILKTDPSYLNRKHIEVLEKTGQDYKVVKNADKLNWQHLSVTEFNSYKYRQVPGELNALGKVKFIFSNSCGIYLHDSNESEIFNVYRRDFSHGCIRVGEPKQLTSYILSTEKDWSEDKIEAIWNESSVSNRLIKMQSPINLYIVYFTSWVSSDDWVQFRRDIYGLDKLSAYSVYLPPIQPKKNSNN